MRSRLAFVSALALAACADTSTAPPAQTAAYPSPPPGSVPYGYPPQQAPQPGAYGPPAAPVQTAPYAQTPPPPVLPPPPPAQTAPAQPLRPLLGPLVGSVAWQAEARAVAKELVSNLSPQNQALVATIPLVFDPHANEVNAFAGCDDSGAPFVAGTEGLLETIDGIAQTKATDELFGTQTYEAYVGVVAPRMVSKDGGSGLLPAGIVPAQFWLDPRRISRAHEIFDEVVGFTFGHELSHHYLGHTGCAAGQTAGLFPGIAQLDQLASSVIPLVNQPNEVAADMNGCVNLLDTGRASLASRLPVDGGRRPVAPRLLRPPGHGVGREPVARLLADAPESGPADPARAGRRVDMALPASRLTAQARGAWQGRATQMTRVSRRSNGLPS